MADGNHRRQRQRNNNNNNNRRGGHGNNNETNNINNFNRGNQTNQTRNATGAISRNGGGNGSGTDRGGRGGRGGGDRNNAKIPKTSFPIGYVKLKEMLDENDDATLILKLSFPNGGFMSLLKETKIESGKMCMVLEVLAKVAQSAADEHTRQVKINFYMDLLADEKGKSNHLQTHLVTFIASLFIYMDESHRDYIPHMAAVDNLLILLRSFQETVVAASFDMVFGILLSIRGTIDHVNRKGTAFSKETMQLLADIDESVNNLKQKENEIVDAETTVRPYEPPDDFRQISICPSIEDIRIHKEFVFVPKNLVTGKYVSGVDHYLDVQFRLLREDFVRPLREGICEYVRIKRDNELIRRKINVKKVRDLNVYDNVRIMSSNMRGGYVIYNAKFDTDNFQNIRWQVGIEF